ncbi:MAG: hypothetical protein IH623_02545 [Verrucomicrobia bacterium]|nr:hypothetical protein [Verrucomicrobiota bacterium]
MRVEITTEDVVVSTAVVSTKPSINRDTITRVVDYRLMTSSGPVSYITTNDLIEPDSATAQTLKTQFEQFEEDKRKRPSARSQQRAKRVFLFLLFGAVTVGPLVIWGVLRGRTQQNA